MFSLSRILKVINPEPVVIDQRACLPARHRRSACRACIEVCQEGALALDQGKLQVDASKCSRCSLCAGACPTAAIAVMGIAEKQVTAVAGLRCSKVAGEGPQVPCLGWLTADHLIGMALQHETVTLTAGDCAACPWARGGEMAAAAAAVASATLKAVGHQAAVRLIRTGAGAAPPERTLSRRDLFSLWTTESQHVVKTLLPERDVNHAKLPAHVPARRSYWIRRLAPESVPAAEPMPDGPWKARVVTEACNGCGICTAFCPTGALSQSQDGEDWVLTHLAAACVSCGTCVALCPTRAVGEEPLLTAVMVAGKAREVRRLRNQRCPTCRVEFRGAAGEAHCPRCGGLKGMLAR